MNKEFKQRKQRLYDRVIEVMLTNTEARESNAAVVKATQINMVNGRADNGKMKADIINDYFNLIEAEKLPGWESITRERRYAVANNPQLAGSKEAVNERLEEYDNNYQRAIRGL